MMSARHLSAAALAIFLRPWLALALVAFVVVLPSYLITDFVFNDTNARLEGSRRAEQGRAARTGAKIVADRVAGLRADLVAVAGSRSVRDAITGGDAATLSNLAAEFAPVVGIGGETLS